MGAGMKKSIIFILLSIFISHDICKGQGLSDLQYDDSNSQASQITIDIINRVYAQTQDDFNFEIQSFTQTLTKFIEQLGVYSDSAADQFDQACQQELDRSTKQIHTISKSATRQYYDELTKNGLSSGVGVADPVAKQLEQDINSIENDMINELRSTIAILQSKDPLPAVGQDIQSGVDAYQQMAAQEYATKEAQASQAKKTSWWKDLKLAGKDFLGDVAVNLEKECKIALSDAVSDTINQLGQEAVNQIVSYGGDMLSSVFEFGTDLIGKQLTETFEKYTSKQLDQMFQAFPDYLKTQAFKAAGINPDEDTMVAGLKAVIRQKYPVTQSFSGLQVRQSKDVSSYERAYLNNRMPKVAKALQDNFGITKPLNIGLCASGGGNRAMLVTLGFYLGAQDIGLFDSLLYTAGVSGSTWTIAPWSYLNATQGMSLTDFKNNLVHGVLSKSMLSVGGTSLPPMPNSDQQMIIATNSAKHFAYDQTVSSIDLYGGFIGNFSLQPVGKDRLNVTWSSIADIVIKGDMPMPMGSAVSYKQGQTTQGLTEYNWYEVSPFEVGSSEVGAYVPTWAFGSKFDQGKPVDGYQGQAPEYPISYYEGVFGSAFAASINEVVDQKMSNPTFTMLGQKVTVPVDTWIKTSLSEDIRDSRFYPATFHNYTAGLSSSPIAKSDDIRLYDGAMSINFPLPLLMRQARDLDVIVVCDAAVDLTSLQSAQVYAQHNGLKFPDMTKYTEKMLASKPLTVLNNPLSKDYDKDMITILYCPFVKNDGFSADFDPKVCSTTGACQTFNFKYSDAQAEQVVDLVRYNVNQIHGEIQDVLQALQALRV